MSIEALLALFRKARDLDFEEVVETGALRNHYSSILHELNQFFIDKQVIPLKDLTDLRFTLVQENEREVELGLEDLSRGELKRLMVYAWLKSTVPPGSVVLMDEVELSFHPDWQFGIVRDLEEWAPDNQFILATHSYDLCEALTPMHALDLGDSIEREKGSE